MSVASTDTPLFVPDIPIRGLAKLLGPALKRHRKFRASLAAT
ncbi:hypothetical protein LX81_02946 [Palleronia aestuarii]|uniref:Uncharacterized protein n=1 Tax=Palleronia aestuarii TaxID=568105 RepID=A0A2W7N3U7_9RHOB|nr:hypothetical protein [Palleronia aestuarii]PZX14363.1 hypothetical protein LX81_02946 [Palleronia aestuarii]